MRHGHTKQNQLAHAVAALRSVDATVYGVVLTMVPTRGPDAYYSGYNYHYNVADHAAKQPMTALVTPRLNTTMAWGARADAPTRNGAAPVSDPTGIAAAEVGLGPSTSQGTETVGDTDDGSAVGPDPQPGGRHRW